MRELEKLQKYERVKTQELLRDFPHLSIGGLLPDPISKEREEVNIEPLEWSVVVFPKKQGRRWRMIRPDASFNTPPLEGD